MVRIRNNILTESNIRELVRMLDEEMDGIACERWHRLEIAKAELADVKHRLTASTTWPKPRTCTRTISYHASGDLTLENPLCRNTRANPTATTSPCLPT